MTSIPVFPCRSLSIPPFPLLSPSFHTKDHSSRTTTILSLCSASLKVELGLCLATSLGAPLHPAALMSELFALFELAGNLVFLCNTCSPLHEKRCAWPGGRVPLWALCSVSRLVAHFSLHQRLHLPFGNKGRSLNLHSEGSPIGHRLMTSSSHS